MRGSPTRASAEAEQPKQPKRLPCEDAVYCVRHLHQKMKPETFLQGARVWMDVFWEGRLDEYKDLLTEFGAG